MKTLAIIGGGPRGLSSLESIYSVLASSLKNERLHTYMFEETGHPGSGAIYDIKQPNSNWLNISERGLTLPARNEIKLGAITVPAFPSYQEWAHYCDTDNNPQAIDLYPLRSTMGCYLNERFISIAKPLQIAGIFTVVPKKVSSIIWAAKKFTVHCAKQENYEVDEVRLTIGHQPTEEMDQVLDWKKAVKNANSVDLIQNPYPVSSIVQAPNLNENSVVAIMGFGLATIDVIRALTVGRGGSFEIINEQTRKMHYKRSGKEPSQIIPFSLDGLSMSPKLVNLALDKLYFPSDKEKETLNNILSQRAREGDAVDCSFLKTAMLPIISRVYLTLNDQALEHNCEKLELESLIKSWLDNEDYTHPLISSKKQATRKYIESFVGMATGTQKCSLDFCIGHVWRHCQPIMYKALSFSSFSEELVSEIVELDERLKRYTYGPPVASLQQVLALIDAGIVSLDYIEDPDVNVSSKGWTISKNSKQANANVMVKAILDPPQLLKTTSPIIASVLEQSLVKALHTELGIHTDKDSFVITQSDAAKIPLSVSGRLAKGTLIGVDAILECFNHRSELWAQSSIGMWDD